MINHQHEETFAQILTFPPDRFQDVRSKELHSDSDRHEFLSSACLLSGSLSRLEVRLAEYLLNPQVEEVKQVDRAKDHCRIRSLPTTRNRYHVFIGTH